MSMTQPLCRLARFLRRSRSLVLTALMCGLMAPGHGAIKEKGQNAGLSGAFVVGKEYGTELGTYLTDVRGKDLVRLNYLFGEDVNPRFSPTDDRILFTSTRSGALGIWTMNRKGEGQKRLCDGDQGDWFPDGQRITFRRRGQIFERLLETGQEAVLSAAGWESCAWPACSPDGKTILFVTNDGEKDAIWLTTRGQSEPRRIAEGEIPGAPRWAPGGERIVCQCGAHLWLLNADGSNKRQLTTDGGIQRRPAWSPDGMSVGYCQGPGPKGPWAMAVIRADGTRRFSIPLGDTRSVLCSDWGVEEPGRKPERAGMAIQPPPRIRLWETKQPVTAGPVDWTAFCRERTGWKAVQVDKGVTQNPHGVCAIESDSALFLLFTGRPGAVLIPKPALQSAIVFNLLDPQGREAGPVESFRVLDFGPDEAALESSAYSAGALVKARWAIGGSRVLVQVASLENADKLRIAVPLQCVVMPDRYGNDFVADPDGFSEGQAFLPWAPLLTGLLGSGSNMLVLVCPEPGQRTELRKGNEPRFAGVDVAFQNHGLSACLVTCERAWHLERFGTTASADTLRFNCRMPCAAACRLTVQGEEPRYSTLFSDKEPAFFDGTDILFRMSKDFEIEPRLGVIYLYGRTASTPLEVLTPLDLARDTLGLRAADRSIDEEGVTGYRRAAGPTTWADLSVTLESLRYLFERQLEVQDFEYVRHLSDDLLPFAEGIDQRLSEYADFARDIDELRATLDKTSPVAVKFLEALTLVAKNLDDVGKKQLGLPSSKEVLPISSKIAQLAAKEARENRRQFDQFSKQLLGILGPREEMLKTYRKLTIGLRDTATIAPLGHAELLAPAEKIRTRCQQVLRNRFYAEADWRGEDYSVPAYWLGPRPYE